MQALEFDLYINATDYQSRYQMQTDVLVRARNGLTLRFPASCLQRFVTHDGVQGSFQILFDDTSKLIDLVRLN